MSLKINVIAATCDNFGIGSNGDLPWKLKNELAYFHRITRTTKKNGAVNVVIMGSRTYFSNPKSVRPFKGRLNIVLSRKIIDEPGVLTCSDWDDAISYCMSLKEVNLIDKVWVIGGNTPYKIAMESPYCHRVYLTRVYGEFDCDVFFPALHLSRFRLVQDPSVPTAEQEENDIKYRFEVYEAKEDHTRSISAED